MKPVFVLLFAVVTALLAGCVTESTTKTVVMNGDASVGGRSSDTHRISP
jgi:hypothetical protein